MNTVKRGDELRVADVLREARTEPRRARRDPPPRSRAHVRELDERSSRLAQALLPRASARARASRYLDRTAPEIVELLFATSKIGAVTVPLNWRLAAAGARSGRSTTRRRPC